MATTITPLDAQQFAGANIPKVIRSFIRMTGTTQRDLAEGIGIQQPALSKRLCRSGFSAEELLGIAAYFGVDVGVFYGPVVDAQRALLDANANAGPDPEYPRIYLP